MGGGEELEKGENDRAGWSIRTESGSTQGKLDYWLCKDAAVGDIVVCCVPEQSYRRRSGWSGRWSGPILPVLLGLNFLNCNSVFVHQL